MVFELSCAMRLIVQGLASSPPTRAGFPLVLIMKKEWLQQSRLLPHFDLAPSKRKRALENGAVETNLRDWMKKMEPGAKAYQEVENGTGQLST